MSFSGFLKSGAGTALILALLGALLYFPSFALDELDDEEGRRAVPAREMIESGDYMLPTLWGEPYLNKPPLFFWLIATSSLLTDGVTEASTRLPSVLATILTALLLAWFGRKQADARTGMVAGALFLVSLSIFEKGSFGELEAVFTLTVFCAIAALYAALQGSRRAALATGIALTAAMLTKGPPALVFFFAAAIAIALSRREYRCLLSPKLWLPVVAALVTSGGWALLALARPEVENAISTWSGQLARGANADFGEYLDDRKSFAGSVLLGFFPPLMIALIALRTELNRRVAREPLAHFALFTVCLGLLFFGLMPGTNGRYVHPLIPWIALLAARLITAQLEVIDSRFEWRLKGIGRFIAAMGLAVVGGACWLVVKPIAGFDHLSLAGWVLVLALFVVSVASWRSWRAAGSRALWSSLAVLALLRLIQIGEITPQAAGRQGRELRAASIAEQLPQNEPLYVGMKHFYNLLFYVDHPIRPLQEPLQPPPGAYLLLHEDRLKTLEDRSIMAYELLLTTDTHEGVQLSLIRVAE